MSEIEISILIPTYGRPKQAAALRAHITGALPPNYECVIVNQGEVPIESDQRSTVINLPVPNLPAARNAAIRASTGEILLFLDDDVVPPPDIAHRHVFMHLRLDTYAGLAGSISDDNNHGTHAHANDFDSATLSTEADFCVEKPQNVVWACGAHMSFKRSMIGNMLFDPWFTGNANYEDVDFALRLGKRGHKIRYEPYPRVEHLLETSGGCRLPGSVVASRVSHFRNAAFCYAKNCDLGTIDKFLTKQKNDLEYFSRTDNGRNQQMVVACLVALCKGLILGVVRRTFRGFWPEFM